MVFGGERFQLLLGGGGAGQGHDVGGQLLFAGINALADDIEVAGLRIEAEIFLIMENGGGGIGRLAIVQAGELKVGGGGARVGLDRLLKGLDGTRKIPGVHAVFAEHVMRFLFLIHLVGINRHTAAGRQ